jgi:RNA polymerase sigma-70 factor (ECF subfamily)
VARLADERTDGVPEPDEAQLASVAAAFNRLGPADREVLSLVAWEGLKPREAAPVLGMSAALFSVRLHRAKRRLRKEMEQAGQERDMQGEGRESIRPDNSPNVVRLESR